MGLIENTSLVAAGNTTKELRKANALLAQILHELRIANARTAPPPPPRPEPEEAVVAPEVKSRGRRQAAGARGPMTIILGATPEATAAAHRGFLEAYPGAPVHAISLPAQAPLAIEPGDVIHVFGLAAADATTQAPVRDFIYRSMMAGSKPAACVFDTQVTFMP